MPVEMSTFQLPGGTRCLRTVTSGHFSKEDAEVIVRAITKGGPMFGMPRLYLAQKQESISPEARRALSVRNAGDPWVAVVVTNPLIRVTANFLVRVNRTKNLRLFSSESEAIQWLDEQTCEGAAKAGAP